MTAFRHYVSLGYFCSVALDLERLGLRDASGPFDWCISEDFDGVLRAVRDHFAGYLDAAQMSQSRELPEHYRSDRYGVQFFHDFEAFSPLSEQLPEVRKKYERRIARFYENIAEPTLFIRYITDYIPEGGTRSAELVYIEDHLEEIQSLLKSFNPENEIIFIGNRELKSDKVSIYAVEKDRGDTVARKPADKNPELMKLLDSAELPWRAEAVKKGRRAGRARTIHNIVKKLKQPFEKLFRTPYRYQDQY